MSTVNRSLRPPTQRAHGELRAILSRLPVREGAPSDAVERLGNACRHVEDWGALLLAAHEHGVEGVVLEATAGRGFGPPKSIAEGALRRLRMGAVWRDALHDALRAVLGALAEKGIRAASLKGPVLAARLYEDAAVRVSTDLDVLVDPESLDAAVDALRPLGYEPERGEVARFFREHHHHVHVFHPTLPVVELHFAAYRGFGAVLPAATLLARARPCTVLGWEAARILCPEDEFVYLAVHAASHRFQLLIWLFDLKLLAIRHPDLRWDEVASRAESLGFSAVVSLACHLLSEWLDAPCGGVGRFTFRGRARAAAVERLQPARSIHLVNAATDFLFCALLCDDLARATAFSGRFLRTKLLHEMPMRARALLSS